jgi:hypothetical protein
LNKRSGLHVDLDAFFVSVERVLDPSLYGKPVGGSSQQRARTAIADELREKHVGSSFSSGGILWVSD